MGMKYPSVVSFYTFHSKGPFEVGLFEHLGLEHAFNMAATIAFRCWIYIV